LLPVTLLSKKKGQNENSGKTFELLYSTMGNFRDLLERCNSERKVSMGS
jgi:hypothetical protein